jgi:hypothetical protein
MKAQEQLAVYRMRLNIGGWKRDVGHHPDTAPISKALLCGTDGPRTRGPLRNRKENTNESS